MNSSRYEATGFGNLCTYFHNITLGYDRLSRSSNVLPQQDNSFCRNLRLYDRLMC